MKTVLTIAGSDSGGGAGIQADLKTFAALRVFGFSAITAVTAQNTRGVTAIENISPELVLKQIEAIFADFTVDAVKIGMVASNEIIQAIIAGLKKEKIEKIVIDPVMVAESGSFLLAESARKELLEGLLPLALLITPNMYEAGAILNREVENLRDMKAAAQDLYRLCQTNILLKGGHLSGEAVDVFYDGRDLKEFSARRIMKNNNHGTGCTFSSAIAAYLARGYQLTSAIEQAKIYISGAIKHGLDLGEGAGPTHHFFQWWGS